MVVKFNLITSPIIINGQTINNRVVVPPMADFGMTLSDGLVNERHIKHYSDLSSGGAGLIIIEACAVSNMYETRNTIGIFDDSCISGMSKLAKKIKSNQTMVLVQLVNSGLSIMPEETIAQISRENFLSYKADFISAAVRCKKAGFDGVELHAAHGFYLNQIVETSTRTDQYGGNFENRIRIIQELISEIKAICGKDFIVAVRFGNHNIHELLQGAQAIEKAGGDILDISTGCSEYHDTPVDFPYDSKIYAASLVKRVITIPVICVGNITTGEQAEQILELGYADMTAVGRGHLCDPYWTQKVIVGEKPNLCISCRNCMWYIDGRRCPAIKGKRKDDKKMEKKKTLRITFPQWQGGVNPDYMFGSELLSHIAPVNANDETVTIGIEKNFTDDLATVDGIDAGDMLLKQMEETEKKLNEKQPDKIIIFGGDCSISQVPFDYLKSKYGNQLGILWLDAHPDVSNTKDSSHLHEMVLGNLLGENISSNLTKVKHPFKPNQVMLAGLIEEDLREMDKTCKKLNLRIASPTELKMNSQAVIEWIEQNNITYLAVHWDLDVLSPADFRSILTAQPYINLDNFPAAVGKMTLHEVGKLLNDVSEKAEIVGLGIAEHMPWDAINLRNTLSKISIFKS